MATLLVTIYSPLMLEDTALVSAMGLALAKLLRPLVRLLLKHSFPYSAFESIAKRVYAESAMEDFALPGRKPSVSRASILTGLTRKEVNSLLTQPWAGINADSTHYNRAARVLTAWVREPEFTGANGSPRHLPMEGAGGFSELVRLHGADVPVRAVLDELVRVGSVEVHQDGTVRLVQRAFVPSKSIVAKLGILGNDVSELIDTIAFNIEQTRPEDARYQRKVMHVDIPIDALPAFRALSAQRSQKLLETLDAWLSAHDSTSLPEPERVLGATARVGVGIHYFEQISGTAATKDGVAPKH